MPLSATPTVRSIIEAVRARIQDGSYEPGAHLPSETELSVELGVSRGSVRRAIEILVERGDLSRRRHARPVVAGPKTKQPSKRGTDVYVWVAQTIADDSSLPFLQGISRGLSGTPYRMVVREPSLNVGTIVKADERQFFLDLLHNPSVAGAIVWRDVFADHTEEVAQVLSHGLPLVFVDSPAPGGLVADHVGTANVTAARRCVEHLLELGHRRIVCITDSETPTSLNDRVKGYWRAMRQAGLEDFGQCVVPDREPSDAEGDERLGGIYARHLSKDTYYSGLARRTVANILALDPLPTALFVGYDILAYWICATLEGYGIGIPEQMSVVGFDWRAHWDKKVADALTTASQDFEGFGRHSADILLDRITGDAPPTSRYVLLDAPMVVRSSTAPPKSSRPDGQLMGFRGQV